MPPPLPINYGPMQCYLYFTITVKLKLEFISFDRNGQF